MAKNGNDIKIQALGAGDYGAGKHLDFSEGWLGRAVKTIGEVLDTGGALLTQVIPGIITYGVKRGIDQFEEPSKRYTGTLSDWVTKDGWIADLRKDVTGGVVNSGDPYEINTILDVISPSYNPTVAAKYGDDNAWTRTKAMFSSAWDFFAKPMLLGEFSKVGINALMSVSEGLDAVANPIKAAFAYEGSPLYQDSYFEDYNVALSYVSQVSQEQCQVNYDDNGDVVGYTVLHPETGKVVKITTNDYENYVAIVNSGRTANIADMDLWERLKSSVGLGEHGRINYNIDTSSTGADILSEILLDPTTYLSFGVAALRKPLIKATKTATKEVLTEFAAKGSKEFSEAVLKAGEDKIVREVLDAYTQKSIVIAANSDVLPAVQQVLKEASSNAVEHSFKVKNARAAIQGVLAKNGIDIPVTDNMALEIIKASLNKNKQTMLHTVTTALATTDKTLSKAMWWAGGSISGLAPTVALLKRGRGAVARNLSNAIEHAEAIHVDAYGAPNIMNFNDQRRIFKQAVNNSSSGMNAVEKASISDELPVDIYALQSSNVTKRIGDILADDAAVPADQLTRIDTVLQNAYKTNNIKAIIAQYETVAATAPNAAFLRDTIDLLKQLEITQDQLRVAARRDLARDIYDTVRTDILHFAAEKNKPAAAGLVRGNLQTVSKALGETLFDYTFERGINIVTPRCATVLKQRIDGVITRFNEIHTIAPELQHNILELKRLFPDYAHMLDDIDVYYRVQKTVDKQIELLNNAKSTIDTFVGHNAADAQKIFNSGVLWNTGKNESAYRYLVDEEALRLEKMRTDLDTWFDNFNKQEERMLKYVPKQESDILTCVALARNAQEKAAEAARKILKDAKLPPVHVAGELRVRPEKFDDILKEYFLRGTTAESADDIVAAVRSMVDTDRAFIKNLLDAENNEFLAQQIDDVFNSNPILLLLKTENTEHVIDAATMVTYNDALHSLVYQLESLRKDAFAEAQNLSKVTDRTLEMQEAHVVYAQKKTVDIDARIAKLNEQRDHLIKQYNKESEVAFTDNTVSLYYDAENDKLLIRDDPKVGIIEKIHALDKQIKNVSKEYDKVSPVSSGIEAANIKEQRLKDINDALTRLEYYALPTEATTELIAFEDLVAFKLSQVAQTEMLLDAKSGLQDYIDSFSSSEFTQFENTLYGLQQQGLPGSENVAWDTVLSGLHAIDEIRTQVPALLTLQRVLQQDLGLTAEQYSALNEALTKLYYKTPADLLDDQAIDELLKDAINNDMFTKHYTRRLSLEDIGAENKARLNELRQINGYEPLSDTVHETHSAIEDSINNFVLHEELINKDAAYAARVKDKHTIFVDVEAQNAETAIGKNQIHSIAIVEYDSAGKIVQRKSIALNPEKLNYNPEMLYKLFPEAGTTTARMQLYKEMITKQATHGVFDTESDLAKAAYEYIQSLAEIYGAENMCLIGHNISAFDAPVLNNTAKIYSAEQNLFNFDTVDTLTYARAKYSAGTIAFTTPQQKGIADAVKRYASNLQQAGVQEVCTPIASAQMKRIEAMCDELLAKKVVTKPTQVEMLKNIGPSGYKLRETLNTIKTLNQGMQSELFPKSAFVTGPAINKADASVIKDAWTGYFKSVGLSDEDIAAKFGSSLDALTTSSILGACTATQQIATKNLLSPDRIRQWFAVDALLVDGMIPKNIGFRMQNLSKSLQRSSEKFGRLINNPAYKYAQRKELYRQQVTELYNIYKATNRYTELDSLIPFDQLTDVQQLAVVSYMIKNVEAKTGDLPASVFTDPLKNMSPEREATLELLTQPRRGYEDMLSDAEIYKQYKQAYADIADLKITLDDMTNIKDANGMIGAALAVRMRALQPLFDFAETIGTLTKEERIAFSRIDSDAAIRRSKGVMADVIHTPPAAMKARLIGSHGVISLDVSQFTDARIKTIMRKYDTPALQADGVYVYLDKNTRTVWFTLDKSAGVTARIDSDLRKTFVYVNGKEVDPYVFGSTPVEKCYGAMKAQGGVQLVDTAKFAAAEQNLMQVSENAIAGSDYTLMTSTRLKDLYFGQMPPAVRAHYDYETFSSGAFFRDMTFNRSILKVDATPLSLKLYNAAQHVMDMAKSDTLYKQCMYSDLSAIKPNTALGTAILQDAESVAKVFRNNSSYVGASLGMRNGDAVIVKTYDLGNAADLRALVRDGGQIFDYTEYAKIYDVINNKYWSEAGLTAWRKLVSIYKIGTLVNPGTWTRNLVDSLIKNAEATGNVNILSYYFKASKKLNAFDHHAAQITKARDSGLIVDELWLQQYFKNAKDLSYEEYSELKQLMGIDVFGGESKTFTKLEKEHQAELLRTWRADGSIDARTYNKYNAEAVLRNIASKALAPMSWTENVARYAMYYSLKDQGFGINKIAKKIADTHFDYANKSAFEHSVEGLIPFYTFQRRNLNYWIEVAENNPAFLVQLSNIMGPLIDMDQYSPEELSNSNFIQYHVLSGNIKLGDNLYINASFSFMDAYTRITNILGTSKDSVFNPLQIVLDAALQGGADEAYRSGNEMLSNWMQNAFGFKMTDEQVRAKYGAWTENFYKLTNYQASLGFSLEGMKQQLTKNKQWLTLIPAVGTQLYRLNKTHVFLDDDNVLNGLLNLTGLFNFVSPNAQNIDAEYAANKAKYRSWLQVFGVDMHDRDPETGKEIRTMSLDELKALYARVTDEYRKREGIAADQPVSAIGVLLQDESNRYYYARMKSLLGYPDTKYSELPDEVKEALYFALTDQVDLSPYIPVLQDPEMMRPIWYRSAAKYDVVLDNTDNLPAETVLQMYEDIAKSVTTVGNIMDMLQDPQYRGAYVTAKEMLGLSDMKLNQIPCDVLELIETYMVGHLSAKSGSAKGRRYYRKGSRVYHTMTYSPLGTPAYEMRNLNMHGTPQRNSYTANKYGVRSHQRGYHHFYKDLYTKSGKERMKLRMLPITPDTLKYRIKDQFYYYK